VLSATIPYALRAKEHHQPEKNKVKVRQTKAEQQNNLKRRRGERDPETSGEIASNEPFIEAEQQERQ
jgi:hypothetical protein